LAPSVIAIQISADNVVWSSKPGGNTVLPAAYGPNGSVGDHVQPGVG
jgi:hypothetical protein